MLMLKISEVLGFCKLICFTVFMIKSSDKITTQVLLKILILNTIIFYEVSTKKHKLLEYFKKKKI